MRKAISPKECVDSQKGIVTDWLIKIINSMLTQSWDGKCAVIKKYKIQEILESKGYDYNAFKEHGGLKFEPLYEEQGWRIEQNSDSWIFTVVKGR
jgi:hypothetical protein